MGSAAFQLSVALFPVQLEHYAFLVWWAWAVCGICWAYWLLTAPWMKRHIWCRGIALQSAISPVVPLPSIGDYTKPSHNVQFAGFKLFPLDPDLPDLALGLFCFENVLIPGKPIENFHSARLRVIYRDFSSGETIAEAFPARWHDSPDDSISICADENKCAVIASCIGSKWTTDSLIDVPINPALEYGFGGSEYKRESIPLPLGRIKIKATLIGEQNLSLPPIEGILTLGENGHASFVRHATA